MRLAVDLRPLLEPFESGVTQYTKAMVRELQKRKEVDLDLFYHSRVENERIKKTFPSARHIPLSNTLFHLRSLFTFPPLPRAYFSARPDLIWIPDRRPFFKTDIPVVMTIHDLVPERYARTLSLKGRLWHHLFNFKRLQKLCKGFLVPTFSIAHTLKIKLPKEVTYEGAQIPNNETSPKNANRILKAPFFLTISPLDPRKRLQWFFKMAERFPKAHFVWVGAKPKDSRFARSRALKKRGNLFIYQEISESEKAWFLRRATALLALSEYEGFDLPVLEAVRAKCPVIMSEIPVHEELYKEPKCFVNSLNDLEAAIYSSMQGHAKIPKTRGTYTWEKAAERALLFFFRVLANENRNRGGGGNS